MKTLREYVNDARKTKTAIGHFNIATLEMLHGIFEAAKKLNVPVIIGVSEGERDFVGIKEVVALVKSLREENNFPIFLNADHTYSFERVKEAIDAGFDSVIFDGTELPFDENVAETKKCADYAKNCGRDVIVEAELGFIGKSSKVLEEIPVGVKITEEFLTKPEEAKKFLDLTGADMLAPAVGNIHGMLKGGVDPALNIKRIKEISEAVGVPLVLHGGSGGSLEDFKGAIASGVAIVHISTELRVAYRKALALSLQDDPEQVAPYKYLKPVVLAVERVVEEKLRLFNGLR
ncbi:MAG: class II fructose-bisphosphate aldolase [Candidatus Paceibacterota bacterium]|jgi:fructose-bisphosphate aldolase class II